MRLLFLSRPWAPSSGKVNREGGANGIGFADQSPTMATRVSCANCDASSDAHAWGFALIAAHGWAHREDAIDGRPGWLCARCNEQLEQETTGVTQRRLRVLLVDDEELVLRATQRILERPLPHSSFLRAETGRSAPAVLETGHHRTAADLAATQTHEALPVPPFEVTTALGGQRALELIASRDFDVIVSDISMPGLRGPDLFYAVSLRWPHLARRFVFVTGNTTRAQPELASAVRRSGASDVPVLLEKSTLHRTLVPEIQAAATRRPPRSGAYWIGPASLVGRQFAK